MIEGELWLAPLIESEETERCRRSLERRIAHAALGAFKPVADFDPRKIDRDAVEALFDLDFLREHINVVFIGSGGVGKTMLAQNLAHRAILAGHTARFVSAADMLGDLAAQDGSANLRRRLRHYTTPSLLVLDEVGYMSYGQGYARRRWTRLAGALLLRALQVGRHGLFIKAQELFDDMYRSLADHSSRKLIDRLMKIDLLVIDKMGYLNLQPEQSLVAEECGREV